MNCQLLKNIALRSSLVAAVSVLAFGLNLRAEEEGYHAPPQKPLEPATRYSGRTPIDLSNGIPFNNGTYGKPNPNYEKWAQAPILVPGVSDLPYPYDEKADFVRGLDESAQFVEDAITNWGNLTDKSKPEGKEWGQKAAETMRPILAKYKDVVRQTEGASKTDWEKAQADARRALVELRGTYSSLHHNVK